MAKFIETTLPVPEKPLDILIKHCRMFLYGCNGSPDLYINEVAQDFYSFALMHLTCTMFLTKDSRKEITGGVFHRILDPLGKSDLLRHIDNIFSKKVGPLTLKNYIQERRNLLATHRSLSLQNLSVENQAIVNNPKAISRFYSLMEDLEKAVFDLLTELMKINKDQP